MPAIPDPTYLRQSALFKDLSLDELAVLNGLMRQQVYPAGLRIMATEQLGDRAIASLGVNHYRSGGLRALDDGSDARQGHLEAFKGL